MVQRSHDIAGMDYTSQDVAGIEQKRRHVIAEDIAGMNYRCRVIAGMDNRSQVIAGMEYANRRMIRNDIWGVWWAVWVWRAVWG